MIDKTLILVFPGVGTICLEKEGNENSTISSLSRIPPSTTRPPIPFSFAEYEAIPPQVETGAPLLETTITSPGFAASIICPTLKSSDEKLPKGPVIS